MLEDRSYMKDPMYGSRRSMALNIIIVLGICFVIENILLFYSRFPVIDYFGLSEYTFRKAWLWQLFTYNFLHAPFGFGGFFHILFNCWGIWMFGSAVENAIGPKKLLGVFIGTGVAGGVLQAVGALGLPDHFGAAAVGASAGVFGLIGTYASLFPDQRITMLLFFIIPVTITARFLVIFSLIVAVFGIVFPTSRIAHGAHLGGLLAGLAYVRWMLNYEWRMPRVQNVFRKPKVFVHTRQANQWPSQPAPKAELPSEEFISKEVDPILDKISAHGIQSLTERERKILEAARAKMAKR
ncbi:MAG TPA: rhomboid family intramembrane serine protease [Candidatus Kapabacteria bacterium]|jgi:membrane associated rhomboid family serine protease|nr:rhomboid family intramembrane serine protease [Candidatus Kapabacteria bacterium]